MLYKLEYTVQCALCIPNLRRMCLTNTSTLSWCCCTRQSLVDDLNGAVVAMTRPTNLAHAVVMDTCRKE